MTASLDFLAQVNLAELPRSSQRRLLPAKGMLYFFALAESHVPLKCLGPDASRVLYFPGDASQIPPRAPPEDAGWNQGDTGHVQGPAVRFRDSDAPMGELYPRCPVKLTKAKFLSILTNYGVDIELIGAQQPIATTFKYIAPNAYPLRVADALMYIYNCRNSWRVINDNFSHYMKTSISSAEAYFRSLDEIRSGQAAMPSNMRLADFRNAIFFKQSLRAHSINALASDFWQDYEKDCMIWRDRSIRMTKDLRTLGLKTALSESQRHEVRELCKEADFLLKKTRQFGIREPGGGRVAAMSIRAILDESPEFALSNAEEVAAAHPAAQPRYSEAVYHRMLGRPWDVQDGPLEDGDILLLQLASDPLGPRFEWWDSGNITFGIAPYDLAARRFDRAYAEIEGN